MATQILTSLSPTPPISTLDSYRAGKNFKWIVLAFLSDEIRQPRKSSTHFLESHSTDHTPLSANLYANRVPPTLPFQASKVRTIKLPRYPARLHHPPIPSDLYAFTSCDGNTNICRTLLTSFVQAQITPSGAHRYINTTTSAQRYALSQVLSPGHALTH